VPDVAADLRMLDSSGIGRYLRQVVPRILAGGDRSFALLGGIPRMEAAGLHSAGSTRLITASAPIYSIREQLELRAVTPRDTELFWAPHYNIPLLRTGKLLVTIHDVLHLARPEFTGGRHRLLYARAMFAALRRRASAILCDSCFTADELVRHAGIDRARITVVHPGVDRYWADPVSGGSPHPRPYLLFIGNIKPHKNLRRLIRAFGSDADVVVHDLLIVGRREGFLTGDPGVAGEATRLGSRVRFTGEVDDATLRTYLAHADALVFPSLYEGFGLPPLEAMAAGCPVLASDAGPMPEVCGDAALYFDPRDEAAIAGAIRRLVDSPALAAELRDRGRARAQMFTPDAAAEGTRSVMDRVLAA
jgi:glycosyltransferase involved in cell wall biosynthesis